MRRRTRAFTLRPIRVLAWTGRREEEISFLTRNYPPNYFDVVVIDECHRSAWGAWSEVLTRNGEALQVGLTATPRSLELRDDVKLEKGALEDARITADNIAYFGEPAYSYDISQAVEDGYLAVCEIVRRDIFLQAKTANERETGLDAADLTNVVDPITGQPGMAEDGEHYEARGFRGRNRPARAHAERWRKTYSITCSRPAARIRRRSSSAFATCTPSRSRPR